MKTKIEKRTWWGAVAAVSACLSLCGQQSLAGTQIELGAAQSVSDGLTLRSGATVKYTVTNTTITVSFGQGSAMPAGPVLATVLVDNGVQNSAFKGNFIDRAVNSLRFEITDSGCQPKSAVITMSSAAPDEVRQWTTSFTSLGQSGTVKVVEIPLLRTSWATEWPGNPDEMFAKDIQYVTGLTITLSPGIPAGKTYAPAQSYKIANFVAVNDDGISSPPATLTPMEKALTTRFGYGYGSVDSLTADMKTWDADGDGMVDYIEIQSENDEAFANSIFGATDVKMTENGAEITWTTVKGATYTVLATDELGNGFAAVTALSGIQAADTGFMKRTDAAAKGKTGPVFYTILKQ